MTQKHPFFARRFSSFPQLAAGLVLLVFAVSVTHAQTPNYETGSEGGALRNNLERNLPQPTLPDLSPKPAPDALKTPPLTGDTVVVSRFRFTGNTLLSDRALARSVELYVNRSVDFAELQNAAAMAALAYRDKGYVATVSIPRQEIVDGIVTLKVVEAKYSGASIDGSSTGRINSELILARVEKAMNIEKAVNVNVLDRTLLLLNDLPGASVQGGLAEGSAEGETKVVLQSQSKPLVTGAVNIDSYGARTTGPERYMLDVAFNSPAGKGEQYTLGLLATTGTRYGRGGVSFPVGLDGARLGMNTSFMEYRVIAGETVASKIWGTSSTAGVDLSYPMVRSQQGNLFLSGGITGKWFENYSGGTLARSYESTVATVAANGNWVDARFGGASNQASMSLTTGALRIKDDTSIQTDSFTAKTNGGFGKLNASFSRNQALLDWMSLVVSLSGQYAWKNLDSSEKFYLGGPSGVRAYPVSEGGGSNGQLAVVELRMKLPKRWELRLFHDDGRVKQNVTEFIGMNGANILSYRGYGASLAWQGPSGVTFTATWAQRLGENPLPYSGTTNDQDGTRKIDRLWLAASLPF
jgi:hemolysin activation/secretion protein